MTGSPAEMIASVSNWGRWGPDDELGTLNLVGPQQRVDAAKLVREGRVVGCGRSISPASGSPAEPMLHMMIGTGAEMPSEGAGSAGDWFGMSIHGHTVTHVDSHAHLAWDRQIYNGRDAVAGITASGCAAIGGVEPIGDGVVGRGVLLDLLRARGGEVRPGTSFRPVDLDECLRAQGTQLREGDIALVRFGRDVSPMDDEHAAGFWAGRERAGLEAECLPWIRSSAISMLGTDGIADVLREGDSHRDLPIHAIGIVAMGLWIIDNMALEELARTCEALERWEFMFVLSPLRLRRATGSPVNPVAIF
jgi:kynurenine formamidase